MIGLYAGNVRVPAKVVRTRYGLTWLVRADAVRRVGRRYVPRGPTSEVQRRFGLREAVEERAATDQWGAHAVLTKGDKYVRTED